MSFYIEFGKLLKYYPEKLETDVFIPDEVEIIGAEAFAESSNLNSVVIPEGVVGIEALAFLGCENLLYIDIPDSVEKIGYEAFRYCYALERVKLPRSLKLLDRYAFRECSSLSEITLPDGLTRIEDNAFFYCKRLSHVTLPKNLIEIGYGAFCGCESLRSIEIPEGVTFIGDDAFSLSGLSRAVIPRSIKTIEGTAFINTDNLVTNIPISDWQDEWGISRERYALNFMNSYVEGDPFLEELKEENNRGIREYLFDIELEFSPKDDIKALWYLIKEELLDVEDIEIFSEKMIDDAEMEAMLLDYKKTHFSPEYIEQWEQDRIDKALGIKEYTYRDWNRIFKLSKTNGEYVIRKYRGRDETVIVPGKICGIPVTSIGQYAFYMLDNVRSVLIEEGIVRIETGAFDSCSLTEITLPDTLRSIGVDAFSACEKLTGITIPSAVTDIGEDAFRNCESLTAVTLPDKITAIKAYMFFDTAITEILIPEGVESIDEHAFSKCINLVKVTFPRSLRRIERNAFEDCCGVDKFVLYEEIDYIDINAFDGIMYPVIAAPAGSYAMDFALSMGYVFEELEPPKSPEPKEGK